MQENSTTEGIEQIQIEADLQVRGDRAGEALGVAMMVGVGVEAEAEMEEKEEVLLAG